MAAGARRRARWFALQVLYALDVNPDVGVQDAIVQYRAMFELDLDERAAEFAHTLIRNTHEHLLEIDDLIQTTSRNWRLDRMSRVDRNILRLAAYELRHVPDVPVKVAINEAVEAAKRFGTAESRRTKS